LILKFGGRERRTYENEKTKNLFTGLETTKKYERKVKKERKKERKP
jgi:hypothetical protein